jgi:hypothetical protein
MGSMFGLREYAEAGGMFSYGPSITKLFARAAEIVDRIAQGAKPSDLPIEQPAVFEFVTKGLTRYNRSTALNSAHRASS